MRAMDESPGGRPGSPVPATPGGGAKGGMLGGRAGHQRVGRVLAWATGVFWLGMLAVFHVIFSGMVTSSDQEYGPIGIVFDLMSFFIAIGVVTILGAATGMAWHDRNVQAAAAELRQEP